MPDLADPASLPSVLSTTFYYAFIVTGGMFSFVCGLFIHLALLWLMFRTLNPWKIRTITQFYDETSPDAAIVPFLVVMGVFTVYLAAPLVLCNDYPALPFWLAVLSEVLFVWTVIVNCTIVVGPVYYAWRTVSGRSGCRGDETKAEGKATNPASDEAKKSQWPQLLRDEIAGQAAYRTSLGPESLGKR